MTLPRPDLIVVVKDGTAHLCFSFERKGGGRFNALCGADVAGAAKTAPTATPCEECRDAHSEYLRNVAETTAVPTK